MTTTAPEATVHELKTWPDYYDHLVDGTKTFEYRRNDRGFTVGDVLYLREWDSITDHYTGREMRRRVTYVLPTDISGDFVVLALRGAKSPYQDVFPQLIRYLDEQFGLALRPEHARAIKALLLEPRTTAVEAADRLAPMDAPTADRLQPVAASASAPEETS